MLKHTTIAESDGTPTTRAVDSHRSLTTPELVAHEANSVAEASDASRHTSRPRTRPSSPLLFGNPVFHREVALRLDISRMGRARRLWMALTLVLLLPMVYLIFIGNAMGPGSPLNVRSAAVVLEALLLPVIASSLASGVFTSERERQTWNALLLTRLTASQIVIGKLAGALVPALLFLGAFLPINLVLGRMAEVPLRIQAIELACLLATTVASASIGAFWSWAVRRTQSAQVFTSGIVLTWMLGSFIVHALWREVVSSGDPYFGTIANFVPHWFNPVVVLTELASNRVALAANGPAIAVFLTFTSVVTALLIATPIRRLGKGPREMEH